jgi:hypothetical protein
MRDPQLQIRTITGLVIIAIIITLTLTTTIGTMLLILAVVGASAFEYFRMQPGESNGVTLLQVLLTIIPVVLVAFI